MEKKKTYDFGEKEKEMGLPVWQSPKYLQSKQKAIEMIESEEYKGIIKPSDFWILMNKTKNKDKMIYSGLIISHNGCLKINDTLPKEQRFKPECFSIIEDKYRGGLLAQYIDNELIEYGEVTKTNCQNEYPYAMLLKRTFDRVVLKKSKLAYYGVYSDSEADEFKEPQEVKENAKDDKELGKAIVKICTLQTKMNKLGIDWRGEMETNVKDWILEKAKVESQDISKLDIDSAKRLEVAYNTLIKGMEQKNG